jgi:nucleotide-binding universal stress UspA family protein
MIKSKAEIAGIELNMIEEMDVNTLIEKNIFSIPAYQIKDQIIEQGSKNVETFIKELQLSILRIENYGSMKKVIIPVDFSENAANAVLYAIEFFKNDNAILKLIHTIHPNPNQDSTGKLMEEIIDFNKSQMNKFIQKIESRVGANIKSTLIDSEIITGFTCDVIKNQLDKLNGGIVLLSSSGESNTLKKLFGSVSQDLLKHCQAPTLFVPPNISFNAIDKIAVALDKNGICDRSKSVLLEMMNKLNAKLEFIHIKNHNKEFFNEEFVFELEKAFGQNRVGFTEIETSEPFNTLNQFCAEQNIQMLSLLRKERSFFEELFHSSFTTKAAVQTKLPLLIINQS